MRGLAVAVLLCLAAPVAAQTRIGVRVGDHPAHGRVVLDWPSPPEFTSATQGDTVQLRFQEAATFDLGAVRRPPKFVAAVVPVAGGIDITMAAGARSRVYRLGARLVVDVFPAPPGIASVTPPTAAASTPVASPSRGASTRLTSVGVDPPPPPPPGR